MTGAAVASVAAAGFMEERLKEHKELMVIIADMDKLPLDLRDCDRGFKTDTKSAPDVTYFTRVRARVPRSGWALKRFPGVRDWVDIKQAKYDEKFVRLEKIEPIPKLLVYKVQP